MARLNRLTEARGFGDDPVRNAVSLVTKPVTEPVTNPAVKPAEQPAAEPIGQPEPPPSARTQP